MRTTINEATGGTMNGDQLRLYDLELRLIDWSLADKG